ncbi:unnamed protein product [Prorocentrum cordatum]|uniref:Transmembrane protein n=1 Tax=Prorocentrum cordatum TaxID=2364126 RepID=A0ABN9WG49_9DINO|nr:unnamed protein product [Polarella glacialis]
MTVFRSVNSAPAVRQVLETAAMLLGQSPTSWSRLRRYIGSRAFASEIQAFSCAKVTQEQFLSLRERLMSDDFDEEALKTVCVPVVPLAMWCRAVGVYLSKTRFRGGPEIRPVAAAAGQAPMNELVLEIARGLSTSLAVRASTVGCPDCVCQCSPTLACAEGSLPQEYTVPTGPSGPTFFFVGTIVGALGVLVVQHCVFGARATPPVPAAAAAGLAPITDDVEKVALQQLNLLRQRRKNSA